MDEIQLRMRVTDVALVANAIESHIMAGDSQENTADLTRILAWYRYRLARAANATATANAR